LSNASRPDYDANDAGFFSRLRQALGSTKVEWYPIPIGLGIAVVAFVHFRNMARREKQKNESGTDAGEVKPAERKRGITRHIRPSSGWSIFIYSTIPFRPLSRVWGRFNDIELPVWFRAPGFRLYSWIFGVNLSELAEPDLRKYRNLSEFFYRELQPGIRPVDATALLTSPADGTVLHFGRIRDKRVEQVKGMTYSLDALLGGKPKGEINRFEYSNETPDDEDPSHVLNAEAEFANVNGISYTLDTLLGSDEDQRREASTKAKDASLPSHPTMKTIEAIRKELKKRKSENNDTPMTMHFAVVYLAPGDYHRFHSPTNWVVELRRHFAGELYSVSPYLQRRIANLFVLNERVALLGRWRYGFFSMTPVGATNVGGIKIHFDRELRTNTMTSSKPDNVPYAEAAYKGSSRLLGGHPLRQGEQMGGFNLGSTIVLVFEAPQNFKFNISEGQKIKVGESLGHLESKKMPMRMSDPTNYD